MLHYDAIVCPDLVAELLARDRRDALFAGAECAEVFARAGQGVSKQLKHNASDWAKCEWNVMNADIEGSVTLEGLQSQATTQFIK